MLVEIFEEMVGAPTALVLLFLIILFSIAGFYNYKLVNLWILHPVSIFEGRRIHTILLAGMIHSGPLHLLINVFFFYSFAFDLEKSAGGALLMVLFISGVLFGNAGSSLHNRFDPQFFSMGASAGTLAVMVGLGILSPATPLLPLPFVGQVSNVVLVFTFIITLFVLTRIRRFPQIDHYAHLYGSMTGAVLAWMFG